MQYDQVCNLTTDTYTGAGNRTYDAENKIILRVTLQRRVGLEFLWGIRPMGCDHRVNLRGAIAKVSFARDCGFWRSGGVLQIKLARTTPSYNSEYIYVVAPCLMGWEGEEQYAGRVVCMSVKKMKLGDRCHADYFVNSIDSKGVPFYCLSWQSWKFKEFLKQVDCKMNE